MKHAFMAFGILAGVVVLATAPVFAGGYAIPASRAVVSFQSIIAPPPSMTFTSFQTGVGGSTGGSSVAPSSTGGSGKPGATQSGGGDSGTNKVDDNKGR
jgi:hypothetical protein